MNSEIKLYCSYRNCTNETTNEFKHCSSCREKEREREKANRINKLNKAIDFNKNNENEKMCKKCNGIENVETYDLETIKCSECSMKSKLSSQLRNPRDEEKVKLYNYKKSAKNRNLNFELSDEEFFKLVKLPCHYCGYNESIIGVDRKDSNIGYVKTNVLPCCEQCNLMKNDKSYDDFFKICEHIATINKKYSGDLKHELFHISPNGQFARYQSDAKRREIVFELSKNDFINTVKQKCFYCKSTGIIYYGNTGAGGIDRVDSSKGYYLDNCVPCCYTCNGMKLNYSKESFIEKCYEITKCKNQKNDLENDIIQFFEKYSNNKENVQRTVPTFYHSKDFYEIRKWSGNIEDLKNVKIELEFVENPDQKDLWNYYRWKISSLRTFKPDNFVGRIICILVKDTITNKYLGIMSLSSDIVYMKNRDDAIGWDLNDKITDKKINHLMNLSTCVSIQPFGFNFNGGKLLAKLAFSKEVIDKFREKFNQELLVICTTGLYGKSVQYDRLNELKYVGNTKGNSIYWIPEDVTKKCREYLNKFHDYNTSNLKKIGVISKIISVLNLDKEKIMSSNEKGIYLGFTRVDSKDYLCGNIKKLKKHTFKSANEIFEEWYNRWAVQRFNHLYNNDKLVQNNFAKSTERANRHFEKMKKELGEEKFKEFIKEKNQKTYSNKKEKMKEMINLNGVKNEIKKTAPDRTKKIKVNQDPKKPTLPSNFSYFLEKDEPYFSFNKIIDSTRYNSKFKLRSNNIQKEFDNFIAVTNNKYTGLNLQPYKIPNADSIVVKIKPTETNTSKPLNNFKLIEAHEKKKVITEQHVEPNQKDNDKEFKLLSNFTVINRGSEYSLCWNKLVDGKRYKKVSKLATNDFQSQYDNFVDSINESHKDIVHYEKHKVFNIPPEYTNIVKDINTEAINNLDKQKPIMPTNFSICNVNNVDYIQFCKKIDNKRHQYKTKINSYDLQSELNEFVDKLNQDYGFDLVKSNYKIINTDGWKTTNKIVVHEDTDKKIANREQAQKYIQKKKAEIGEEEFKRQNNLKQKQFREKVKENEIEL